MPSFFKILLTTVLYASSLASPTPENSWKRQGGFIHPGILHTRADLERMRTKVALKQEPWASAYTALAADAHSSPSYKLTGPFSFITRDHSGDQTHLSAIISDGRAAINLALRYYLEQNETFAIASRNILDAWSNTLILINGTDVQLGASLTGTNLVNAAEILRYTWTGWSSSNITRFSTMINDLFVPAASVQGLAKFPFFGNWSTTGEKALIAYGVFLNNRTIYNMALDYYRTGGLNGEATCGSLPYMIPTTTEQYIESGRDQGHTQFSLENMAEISQVALSQGDPSIFKLLSDRLLLGYEYTSEYQITNNTLPYSSSIYCCYCPETFGTWTYLSPTVRYQYRPVREIAYGYYVGGEQKRMPYTKELMEFVGIETLNPVNADNDNAEWGTLRFRRTAAL